MPKNWVKNYFAHGRFPEVGQKQKTEKKEKRRSRLNDGDNNGQATHGARKPPGPKKMEVGNNNGQLLIANATSDGPRKAAWTKIL